MAFTSKQNQLAVATIFLLILITAATSYLIYDSYNRNNKLVRHTHNVIEALQELQINLNAAESEARAFIISADKSHEDIYRKRIAKVDELIDKTQAITRDNPEQQSNVSKLNKLTQHRLNNLEYKIGYRKRNGFDNFLVSTTKEGSEFMHRVGIMVTRMKVEEVNLLSERSKKVEESKKIAGIVILLTTVINVFIVVILIVNVRRAFEKRRVAQLKLMDSYREIVELNRQKNYLLGMAAHDLRNPIANITQICELMFPEIEGKISKQDFEFLKNIQVSSVYVSSLLNDLLDVAIIESGKMVLHKALVEVEPFMLNLWTMNKIPAEKKGIKLLYNNVTATQLTINIDPLKITQVINNLISNALKFSPTKSEVLFRISVVSNMLRVSVKDHGPGIPIDEQHKLFKAFQRTSVKSTGGEKSTGLGLMITSKIVKEHGGIINVDSKPGEGSDFFFDLPLESK